MLEYDAAVGSGPADRLAVHADGAGLDRQKAADQIEQSRFAAAGRPEQRDEFAIGHFERDLIERQHLAAARRTIDVIDAGNDDLGGHGGMQPRQWGGAVKRLRGACPAGV